jgi:hypothetical protein
MAGDALVAKSLKGKFVSMEVELMIGNKRICTISGHTEHLL